MAKTKITTEDVQVQALLDQMRKQGLLPLGGTTMDVVSTPSGIASFDNSTGIGGFPRGRMSVLQGEEGSGKTLLLLASIARVQHDGGRAAFVDLEHALTPDFARLLGVDFDALVTARPRTLNQAYDIARSWWSSGFFDVVGFDSAVALATEEEIEASASDSGKRAILAQLHSNELRKMVSTIHARTAFIVVNQLREDPNPPKWWKGGKRLYSPGGKALRYYSSMTVDVRHGSVHTKNHVRVGHQQKTYIVKNKVAPPYRRAEFDLFYVTGLDLLSDAVATGLRIGLIEKHSSWFTFDMLEAGMMTRTIKENGRESFENALREDPEAYENLRSQVLSLAGDDLLDNTDDYEVDND